MKKIGILLLILCLCITTVSAGNSLTRVVDGADLLSSGQERKLTEKMDKVTDEWDVELAVYTAESLYDYPFDYFEDIASDYIILLISMDTRDWEVLTGGKGDDAVTDDRLDDMADEFLPLLSSGDYFDAFETFVEECDKALEAADPFNAKTVLMCLAGSVIVGLVIALISTGVMRRKLKSVKFQRAAANYEKPGSMQLQRVQDIFLYSHISRVKKPEPNKNVSRSFSGGSFHGGRGGKF